MRIIARSARQAAAPRRPGPPAANHHCAGICRRPTGAARGWPGLADGAFTLGHLQERSAGTAPAYATAEALVQLQHGVALEALDDDNRHSTTPFDCIARAIRPPGPGYARLRRANGWEQSQGPSAEAGETPALQYYGSTRNWERVSTRILYN